MFEPKPVGALIIRNATATDVRSIGRLYSDLASRPDRIAIDGQLFTRLVFDHSSLLLVAELKNEVVGTVIMTICSDLLHGGDPSASVSNIIVDASGRAAGASEALFEAVECVAAREGCWKVTLLSAGARPGAHAFFKMQGYDGQAQKAFTKFLSA